MRKAVFTLALITLACASHAWADADTERGRLLAETCVGCHGVEGYTNAYPTFRVPRIAGQHEAYLLAALEAYRDRERQHPTMVGQSRALSSDDLRDISAYLAESGREEARADRRARSVGDPARGEEVAGERGCRACHGTDGMSSEGQNPPSPILAGQHADFLYQSMKDYQDGTRDNAVMSGQLQGLSDRDLRDMAAFYASQPGPLRIMPR